VTGKSIRTLPAPPRLKPAGLFERGLPVAGRRIGVVLSGGNVDLKLMAKYF